MLHFTSSLPLALASLITGNFTVTTASTPDLREKAYRLRYQVYCRELGFLPPENYPNGCEQDQFDDRSWHFCTLEADGSLAATVRLVPRSSAGGWPMDSYCPELGAQAARHRAGEISRLVLAARYRRCGSERKAHHRPEVLLGLYRAMYQEAKRQGLTHLYAVMEEPLARLLRRLHFPFRPVGPEIDYFGPVRPYVADLARLERDAHRNCPALFWVFMEGLDTSCRPAFGRAPALAAA